MACPFLCLRREKVPGNDAGTSGPLGLLDNLLNDVEQMVEKTVKKPPLPGTLLPDDDAAGPSGAESGDVFLATLPQAVTAHSGPVPSDVFRDLFNQATDRLQKLQELAKNISSADLESQVADAAKRLQSLSVMQTELARLPSLAGTLQRVHESLGSLTRDSNLNSKDPVQAALQSVLRGVSNELDLAKAATNQAIKSTNAASKDHMRVSILEINKLLEKVAQHADLSTQSQGAPQAATASTTPSRVGSLACTQGGASTTTAGGGGASDPNQPLPPDSPAMSTRDATPFTTLAGFHGTSQLASKAPGLTHPEATAPEQPASDAEKPGLGHLTASDKLAKITKGKEEPGGDRSGQPPAAGFPGHTSPGSEGLGGGPQYQDLLSLIAAPQPDSEPERVPSAKADEGPATQPVAPPATPATEPDAAPTAHKHVGSIGHHLGADSLAYSASHPKAHDLVSDIIAGSPSTASTQHGLRSDRVVHTAPASGHHHHLGSDAKVDHSKGILPAHGLHGDRLVPFKATSTVHRLGSDDTVATPQSSSASGHGLHADQLLEQVHSAGGGHHLSTDPKIAHRQARK